MKKALEALPAVDEAVVSHEAGTAIVTLNAEVSDADLKKAVEDQDYKVTASNNGCAKSSALFPIAGDRALLLFLDSLGIGITPS